MNKDQLLAAGAPVYIATPFEEKALLCLSATSDWYGCPLCLYLLDGPFEPYPKGTVTYFAPVTDLLSMTPERAYVLKLTGQPSHVIQPVVGVAAGRVELGRWADEETTLPPIPLEQIEAAWVAVGWTRYDEAPDHDALKRAGYRQKAEPVPSE